MNIHLVNIEQKRSAFIRSVQLIAAIPINVFLFFLLKHAELFGERWSLTLLAGCVLTTFAILAFCATYLLANRKIFGFYLGFLAYIAIASCFAYTLANDTLISLTGIIFNTFTGFLTLKDGRYFHKSAADLSDEPHFQPGALGYILSWLNCIVIGFATLKVGYQIIENTIGTYVVIAIFILVLIVSCKYEWKVNKPSLRKGPYLEWLLLLLIIPASFYINLSLAIIIIIALRQLIVTIRYFVKTKIADNFGKYLFRRPAQLLGLSFFTVITIGTVLLSFPCASATGKSINAIDAFFTATSATCVTGLIVLDTPHAFSAFGQSIILLLIQIGGLGIMTISTFAAIIIGRNIGLGQEYSLTRMIGESSVNRVYRLIKFICLFTFVIELVGASLLFFQFSAVGFSLKTNIWKSVFHSVSAFCNAGFSLQTDNLAMFQNNPGILFIVSTLIIVGGLGFGVLYWLWEFIFFKQRRVSFHIKIVFWSTIFLLIGMVAFVLIVENNGALKNYSTVDKLSNAWLYAVTPRTAGFNTFSVNSLSPITRFVTAVLMFIGVAPGSTGGGVKITTIFVLLLTVRTLMRGDREAQGFNFSISNGTVYRAAAVFFLGIVICVLGYACLIGTQSLPPESVAFETISAFGTVGLSMGATAKLNSIGKLIVIILMYIGRVGPLTLVLSMRPLKRQEIFYPQANVMVG